MVKMTNFSHQDCYSILAFGCTPQRFLFDEFFTIPQKWSEHKHIRLDTTFQTIINLPSWISWIVLTRYSNVFSLVNEINTDIACNRKHLCSHRFWVIISSFFMFASSSTATKISYQKIDRVSAFGEKKEHVAYGDIFIDFVDGSRWADLFNW